MLHPSTRKRIGGLGYSSQFQASKTERPVFWMHSQYPQLYSRCMNVGICDYRWTTIKSRRRRRRRRRSRLLPSGRSARGPTGLNGDDKTIVFCRLYNTQHSPVSKYPLHRDLAQSQLYNIIQHNFFTPYRPISHRLYNLMSSTNFAASMARPLRLILYSVGSFFLINVLASIFLAQFYRYWFSDVEWNPIKFQERKKTSELRITILSWIYAS